MCMQTTLNELNRLYLHIDVCVTIIIKENRLLSSEKIRKDMGGVGGRKGKEVNDEIIF